jgi:dinuclear metal center YbgI/SA1388 family protein
MNVNDVIRKLESWANPALQEGYDNSRLIVGDKDRSVTGVLVSLDATEDVVDEAISKGCNMVVSHHPIVFGGLKSFTGKNYVERTVIKAIKNDIAIYALHTNLDNVHTGVNRMIGERIGIKNPKILAPKKGLLQKLVVFAEPSNAEAVRQAMFDSGAGHIGNYDKCSFSLDGEGTFRGDDSTNPTVGEAGKLSREGEVRIEVILPAFASGEVIRAMKTAHSYEEVAYDLYALENVWDSVGSGMIGELPKEMDAMDFLSMVKSQFEAGVVRYTPVHKSKVKKIAWCGGSGSFLLGNAIASGADVFITSDFKYHQFFDADNRIIIADIGHFEGEQFTKHLIVDYLKENFLNFAVLLSEVRTNPINYL